MVLPREVLAQLGASEGDELIATTAADGSLRLIRGNADLERQLETARNGMARYRNALREVGK